MGEEVFVNGLVKRFENHFKKYLNFSSFSLLVTNHLLTKYLKIPLGPYGEKVFHTRINFHELKINFPVCMQNQIFLRNNYAELNINLRMFLPIKNKRLS